MSKEEAQELDRLRREHRAAQSLLRLILKRNPGVEAEFDITAYFEAESTILAMRRNIVDLETEVIDARYDD